MSSELVPSRMPNTRSTASRRQLAAEHAVEQHLMLSIAKMIAVGIPIGIIFFIGLPRDRDRRRNRVVRDRRLGGVLGVVAAVLFGMLGGVTVNAHALDEVDKDATGH